MEKPVFVDPTGRRLGALRVAGRVTGAVLSAYLVLVAASLVAPPGLDRLEVPGVGDVIPAQRAPEVVTSDGDEAGAADAVDDARQSGAAPIAGPATDPGSAGNAPSKPGNGGQPGGGGRPGAPTPAPTAPTPTPTPVRGNKPTAPPGQSGSAPGQSPKPTAKPTPKAKPTSTSKPGNGQNAVQGPTATATPRGNRP